MKNKPLFELPGGSMTTSLPNIEDVTPVALMQRLQRGANLTVLQCGQHVPFNVDRVFTISGAEAGTRRGEHAHRAQNQFLFCPAGVVAVTVDDGAQRKTLSLDTPSVGLAVPAGIWAEQMYSSPDSVLVVLCDAPFDEADYIRKYEDFVSFRKRQEIR